MKRIISSVAAMAIAISAIPVIQPTVTNADNPLAQNVYTADPAPMVYDGTLYLYTSHDKDNSDYFYMHGGGAAWNVLINDIDCFGYFMPLSGHCWGGAQAAANAIESSKYKDSTYILAATGTDDIAYNNLKPQIDAMKNMSTFTYTSDFLKGNLCFLEADGLTHWWGFVRHYVYDALPYFFHE